jgi:hypothetical protein
VTNCPRLSLLRWRASVQQRYTDAMNLLRLTLLGVAFALPAAGFAQWQWIDKDGRKVYSDRSPPSDIPTNKILKQPGASKGPPAASDPAPASSAPAQAAASAAVPKLSGKEKELEDKRKQAQAAEAAKRKALEEEVAKGRAENCDRAKRNKAGFDSGVRIARTNDKGEREVLDDAQRAAEVKRLNAVIDRDCKAAAGG